MSIKGIRCVGCCLTILLLLYLPSVLAESKKGSPLAMSVTTLEKKHGQPFGPKLVVLLCNTGSASLYVRRELNRVEPWPWNPLQAKVVDLHSGKPAGTRVVVKHAERPLKESDFVELRPHYCYGAVVDLGRDFVLQSGREYSVQFSYSSKAPNRVGKLAPWQGVVLSSKMVIKAP